MKNTRIALLGTLKPTFRPHQVVDFVLTNAAAALSVNLKYEWISTDRLATESQLDPILKEFDGIWCTPGSPYKSLNGALNGIRYAREKGIPFIGTCGGFQHMVIEYARNVLGYENANSIEIDPTGKEAFITPLDCSLAGQTLQILIREGSQAFKIWSKKEIREHYYCNYGINPKYLNALQKGPIKITGMDSEGEPRILELPGHPFFIGTLFVPGDELLFRQQKNATASTHPLIEAFVKASCHSLEYIS